MESISGEHKLVFDEEKHKYFLDGEQVPGVTTFGKGGYPTSEMLTSWMIGQGAAYAIKQVRETFPNVDEKAVIKASKTAYRTKSEEAAAIGSLVHDYAYFTDSSQPDKLAEIKAKITAHPESEKVLNGVSKYETWRAQNVRQTVLLEAIIASVVYRFGGKFDRLSFRDGVLVLSDYKTSSGIYVDQFIQLGGYVVAIEEWLRPWLIAYGLPTTVGALEILRFGKENGDDFSPLLIDDPKEIQSFKEQAVRCRQTYAFRLKWESDRRFKYTGGNGGNSGNNQAPESKSVGLPRKQRIKNTDGQVGEVTK